MRVCLRELPGSDTGSSSAWDDAQALFYARTIAQSNYAERVAPLLDGPWAHLLDIGAGSGALGARLVPPGGRWTAVEPQAAMQDLLETMQPALAARDVELRIQRSTWQDMPTGLQATGLLAAHLGVTHHQAADFFDAMAGRWAHGMRWVVPAQAGPSTFCLAGFLPQELHGADKTPAFERTLAMLGPTRAPQRIRFTDWRCRVVFADLAAAETHFLERLALVVDTDRAREVCRYLSLHVRPVSGGLEVACRKRSAVLAWDRA